MLVDKIIHCRDATVYLVVNKFDKTRELHDVLNGAKVWFKLFVVIRFTGGHENRSFLCLMVTARYTEESTTASTYDYYS
jgi:hypothetical protein